VVLARILILLSHWIYATAFEKWGDPCLSSRILKGSVESYRDCGILLRLQK
jgi:hypothetical protein